MILKGQVQIYDMDNNNKTLKFELKNIIDKYKAAYLPMDTAPLESNNNNPN